jgi:hypothetical protein
MSARRVILVNNSRLLGDMLRRVIDNSDHLETVQEVSGDRAFLFTLEQVKAEWMILSTPSDKTLPAWLDPYLAKHPFMRCLVISPGSSKVRLKWQAEEAELEDLSLKDVMYILEGYPQYVFN